MGIATVIERDLSMEPTARHHPLGAGRRRHRRPDPRRPRPVGQHDERAPTRASMRATRRPARGREGRRSPASSSPRPRRRSSPAATSTTCKQVTPEDAAEFARLRARGQGACCAGWRRSASRSSPPSTARRSAAAWRSRWPATTAIVVDDPKASLGFPEVQLGLLPGAGGVVRTVRMLGIADALMRCCSRASALRPGQGARSSASSTRSSPRATS